MWKSIRWTSYFKFFMNKWQVMWFGKEPMRIFQNEYFKHNKGLAGISRFWKQGTALPLILIYNHATGTADHILPMGDLFGVWDGWFVAWQGCSGAWESWFEVWKGRFKTLGGWFEAWGGWLEVSGSWLEGWGVQNSRKRVKWSVVPVAPMWVYVDVWCWEGQQPWRSQWPMLNKLWGTRPEFEQH